MPDAITPVGTQNHYDPMQGINMLSGVLGLQHQRVGLQQQQQELRTQTAGADQATQRNQELQQAQSEAVNAVKSGKYRAPDGSLDRQGLANALSQIGPYAQENATSLLSQANEVVQNQQAHQALAGAQQQKMGSALGGLATKKDLSNSDLIDTMDGLVEQGVVPRRMAMSMLTHVPPNASPQQLQELTRRWSIAATSPESATAQTNPQMESYNAPGNVLGLRQTNIQYPGGVGNAGGGVVQGATPAQQPAFQGQVAAATTAASGAGGVDNQVFSKVMSAGANSQRGIELAQKLREDVKGIRTGQYTQDFANRLTVFQQHNPGATARQMLQKDAENLKSMAEEGATSDKEREQIGGGYPSPDTMGPDAIEKASRYWEGSFKMAGARRDNAVSHVSQNGTQGLALKDSAFMKDASPGKFAPPEPKSQPQTAQAGLKSKSGRAIKKVGDHYEYAD